MKKTMTAALLLLSAALLTACELEDTSSAPEITVQTELQTEAATEENAPETDAAPAEGSENAPAEEGSASAPAEENAAPGTPVLPNTTGFGDILSFSADTLDGGSWSNADLAAADVTVINLWATFCGPCIAEMPEIAEFRKTLPENVQLLTCCVDVADDGTLRSAQGILSEAGYDGITLLYPTGDLGKLSGDMMYVPTTIFVDSEGHLLGDAIIGGGNVEENYTARINEALTAMGKEPLS